MEARISGLTRGMNLFAFWAKTNDSLLSPFVVSLKKNNFYDDMYVYTIEQGTEYLLLRLDLPQEFSYMSNFCQNHLGPEYTI